MKKKKIRKYSILMYTLLLLGTTFEGPVRAFEVPPASAASSVMGPQSAEEVEAFLDDYFSKNKIKATAVTVAVVRNGQVLAKKGYGVADKTTNKPVQPDQTVFRVASTSKVFTTLAVLQLVDQGKISLQDNIEKYLDGYKVNNPFDIPVTIEMLLTHTTGFEMRDLSKNNLLYDADQKPVSLQDDLFEQFPSVKRKPGTSYMYDNFAFQLQGYIVQKVSGEDFGAYVEKHVFQPLGMTSSSFAQPSNLAERFPTAYDRAGKARPVYRLSPEVNPQGSMITTADDMIRFMQAFLNDGKSTNGASILSPASIKAMETYKVSIHPQVPDVAYGFEAPEAPEATNGQYVISKGGDMPDFSSGLWLLPDSKTGVFISYTPHGGFRNDFFAAFMDHYYPGQKTQYGKADFKPQAAADLHKFSGAYTDLLSGSITKVSVIGDGRLDVYMPWAKHEQVRQVDDKLFVDEKGLPLAFHTDSQGKVTYMKYNSPFRYSAKASEAAEFPDVSKDHPYAQYIHGLQSLGKLTDNASQPFQPLAIVSRGKFIHDLVQQFGLTSLGKETSFTDIGGSEYKDSIQSAADLGLIDGAYSGLFEPDRPILREEAAVILSRLVHRLSTIQVPDATLQLAPGTDDWALASVQKVVALKLHGPEVTMADNKIDFRSKQALTKQEECAMLYSLLIPNN